MQTDRLEATTGNYWSVRQEQALENSRRAPNAKVRDVYLEIAEHYRSLKDHFTRPCGPATDRWWI